MYHQHQHPHPHQHQHHHHHHHQASSIDQLRELSSNDLNFLETSASILDEDEEQNGLAGLDGRRANSTVRDLENILDKFEADTQLLLDNPNQLLNCKYDISILNL